MLKCRRRQATDPQKLKKIVNGRFLVFVGGSGSGIGSGRKITACTSLLARVDKVMQKFQQDMQIKVKLL